jgi:DNA primase
MRDIDKIKEKIDIVDFIKSYVDLKKAGKNFKGLCPFHKETDGSFIVSPERQSWHCFGCNAGGDVIKFVMLYENYDFVEAIQYLSEKTGIKIKKTGGREQKILNNLYEINREAENFYFKNLLKNKKALIYLKKRGLVGDTIKEFKLGYASGGDDLILYLLDKGYKMDDISKAGLSFKNDSGLNKDRFINRIMFPLHNRLGKTVGFSGRVLEKSDKIAKYINTPQTPIYNKSKILYGLDKTKKYILDSKEVFLVEGQMDVLMSWQTGIKNVVAVSGTALTTEHLINLKRLADTVLVSFDNDSGGLRALERAIDLLGKFDFHIKAVDLGNYGDPAEVCLDNPEFLKNSIKNSLPAMILLFKSSFKEKNLDLVERKKIIRRMLKKIKSFQSSIDQDNWIKELSKYSEISENALRVEFEEIDDLKNINNEKRMEEKELTKEKIDLISQRLIILGFTNEDFLSIVKNKVDLFPKKYREMINNPNDEQVAFLEMKSTYETDSMETREIKEEMEDLFRYLEIERLKRKQINLKNKMKDLNDKDLEKLGILEEFQKIARKIDKLRQKSVYDN